MRKVIHRQTNAAENRTPATTVGVGKEKRLQQSFESGDIEDLHLLVTVADRQVTMPDYDVSRMPGGS